MSHWTQLQPGVVCTLVWTWTYPAWRWPSSRKEKLVRILDVVRTRCSNGQSSPVSTSVPTSLTSKEKLVTVGWIKIRPIQMNYPVSTAKGFHGHSARGLPSELEWWQVVWSQCVPMVPQEPNHQTFIDYSCKVYTFRHITKGPSNIDISTCKNLLCW